MKRLVIDLDNTLCFDGAGSYGEAKPKLDIIDQVRHYKKIGFDIVIFTSRQMRTHQGSIGKINAYTLPVIIDWLQKFNVPYDEIHVGKPWCGNDGFYVDDRAIRPEEFLRLSYDEIMDVVKVSR
jgi:capsule biosynthesis phosphatase